jgi:hypothetical protein
MTDPNPIYTQLVAEREASQTIEPEADGETQQDER